MRTLHVSVAALVLSAAVALFACVGEDPAASSPDRSDAGGTSPGIDGSVGDAGGGAGGGGDAADAGNGCVAPLAACGGDGKCTTATDTNPMHCGACNHDCSGGACLDGRCQPVPLQSSVNAPLAIAVNSTAVFWMESNPVRKCPKSGCNGSPTLLSQATGGGLRLGPRQMVVDENDVFWLGSTDGGPTNQVYIWRCATAGCSLSPSMHGDATMGGILVGNTTHLFRYDPSGSLYKYPKASTTPDLLPGLYLSSSVGFAVDDSMIAFTNVDGSIQGNRGVYASAIDASSPSKIMDLGEHITMSAGVVYASRNIDITQSTIHRCGADGGCGGTGTPMFEPPDGVITDVLADASGVYWTVKGAAGTPTGAVRKCALPDCPGGPKDIARSQASPVALALDRDFVYWANAGTGQVNTGSIMRVRK